MTYSCNSGRHAVASPGVRNQGFEFGKCTRCGRDLLRSGGDWRTVPKGFRVVWRRDPPPAAGKAPARSRARPRNPLAVAAELAWLAARCLGWKISDGLRAGMKALLAPRAKATPVLCLTTG